jgi:hypothetical protein
MISESATILGEYPLILQSPVNGKTTPEEGSQPWLELEAISRVKPSAFHTQRYGGIIKL